MRVLGISYICKLGLTKTMKADNEGMEAKFPFKSSRDFSLWTRWVKDTNLQTLVNIKTINPTKFKSTENGLIMLD